MAVGDASLFRRGFKVGRHRLAGLFAIGPVVHQHRNALSRQPGDVLRLGEKSVRFTKVGELAASNLRELGHVVVYLDPAENVKLLPGAIHAHGTLDLPAPGARLTIRTGSAE